MVTLKGVYAGRIQPNFSGDRASAIDKLPLEAGVMVLREGIHCDQQADGDNHGGPERALLHYCLDHYSWWRDRYPEQAPRFLAPGFGENLSSGGMNESGVLIGDIYRIGRCRVQVSQPRSPCWKLNVRFGVPDLAREVQDNGRCGWFYRILETGALAVGDGIELIGRTEGNPSVAAVMRAIYHDLDRDQLQSLTRLESLAPNWRSKAAAALQGKRFSNSLKRLTGK